MKVVSCIPVRGGSKGIPYKNLHQLGKKRLIDWTLEASVLSHINETWVSTEDDKIKRHCFVYWGSNVQVLDRPEELATDTASTDSVLEHFASIIIDWDILVLIQATSPMTTYVHLNDALNLFTGQLDKYDSAMSVYGMEDNDMMFWCNDSGLLRPVNYDPMNRVRRQDWTNTHYIETGAFYMITREAFELHKCRVGVRVLPIEMPLWKSFEIDTMEDLLNIEKLLH